MTVANPDVVRGLWDHMVAHYDARVMDKADSEDMELVARFLDQLGVMDGETFLRRYTTTIGRTIYVPFQIGVDQGRHSLHGQVRLCAHEFQHVVQHIREPGRYELEYLTDTAARARLEAEAFRSNMELEWFLTGRLLRPMDLADNLVAYACTDADVAVAAKALSMSSRVVSKGGVINEASKVAIAYLEDQGLLSAGRV